MSALCGALPLLVALLASLQTASCLNLANRALANVTANGAAASPTSFSFYSNAGVVAEVTTASLANETVLSLRNNSLTSIPASLFSAMAAVKSIDISENPLTELESSSFVGMSKLEVIECTNTELTVLPTGLVSDCPRLVNASFNHSFIHVVNTKAFADLPNLEAIYMTWGNLTVLYADSFYNLSKLHTLDLTANNLTSIPSKLITLSNSWKALDFTANNLTTVPSGIQDVVASGYVSFNWNLIVEIDAYAFSGASRIHELRLASNAIFTVNSKAFSGMTSLRVLDLSDNIISVIDQDAFDGVDNLVTLLLGNNNLHRLTFTAFPESLEALELQQNRMDLLPDFPESFTAPKLHYLNLSNNIIWSLETNSELEPYPNLVALDLSSNQLRNFTAAVFDPILETIEFIHLDDNHIKSIPRTTFVALLERLLTNISLDANPGVGWSIDSNSYTSCPNGSVFEEIDMPNADLSLYGCIQCQAGTYHDNSTNSCRSCEEVSSRAFADEDGATVCQYCPYSSDLMADRRACLDFSCNTYCWLTLSFGISIPGVIFGSKLLLLVIGKTTKRSRRVNFKEREDMNEWRMGLVMHQLGEISPHDSLLDDADYAADDGAALRIYDLPDETKDMVLETLQEHFELRKQKMWLKLPIHELEEAIEWDDVEWQTFHMHRILSRNYHGEVFLGDYCGSQVVVKRMMTLRFEVRELAETISDIELMLQFRHPQIVSVLGTMWKDPEHLCIVSEYVRGGDLGSLLEMDAMNRTANTADIDVESFSMSASHSESSGFAAGTDDADNQSTSSIASYSTRLQMVLDICLGLAYAHDLGYHHNDLRIRNVLVTESFRCKINDFQHHTRTSKYFGMWMHIVASAAVNASDSGSEDDEVVEHANPEGVRFLEPLMKKQGAAKNLGPLLSMVAPEVLVQKPRHWTADIYGVGILLLEICFRPFVVVESGFSEDEQARAASKRHGDSQSNADVGGDKATIDDGPGPPGRQHSATLHSFMENLRTAVQSTMSEDHDRSFGTTTTTSSLASAGSPTSPAVVTKVLSAIEACLQGDAKRRPTAKALVKLFQQLLEEIQAAE